MFGHNKKSLLALFLLSKLPRNIGTLLLIGGLAGGVIKLLTGLKTGKKEEIISGVYGAVAVAKVFKGADFPMSKGDIIQKYGDKKIEYHIGHMEKLKDILQDIPEQTYNRTTELEHAIHELGRKPKS